MKTKQKPIIGVLGGMGPQASAYFYQLLIEKSIRDFGAQNNDDFPEIVLDSVPVPDFIGDTKNLIPAKNVLFDRLSRLNTFGIDVICMPCNTAHLLYEELRMKSSAPFISMVKAVDIAVIEGSYHRTGLLSSTVTRDKKIYAGVTQKTTLVTVSNKEQVVIEQVIRGILAGRDISELQKKIEDLSNRFVKRERLDSIILGCTELPLIFPKKFRVPAINSLEVLAQETLQCAFQNRSAI
ncbi:aspartate/glutamate racemase family protein [Candidatus Microgenomates bacterium]|nr:MAG: aspartate/glutamate racemase family protein [Candidatus Microgenomates bacterium]